MSALFESTEVTVYRNAFKVANEGLPGKGPGSVYAGPSRLFLVRRNLCQHLLERPELVLWARDRQDENLLGSCRPVHPYPRRQDRHFVITVLFGGSFDVQPHYLSPLLMFHPSEHLMIYVGAAFGLTGVSDDLIRTGVALTF